MYSFGFESDVICTGMDEFKFESASESLVEGIGRDETAVKHLGGVEFCRGAELLDTDG